MNRFLGLGVAATAATIMGSSYVIVSDFQQPKALADLAAEQLQDKPALCVNGRFFGLNVRSIAMADNKGQDTLWDLTGSCRRDSDGSMRVSLKRYAPLGGRAYEPVLARGAAKPR